jgi:hypothetical protein
MPCYFRWNCCCVVSAVALAVLTDARAEALLDPSLLFQPLRDTSPSMFVMYDINLSCFSYCFVFFLSTSTDVHSFHLTSSAPGIPTIFLRKQKGKSPAFIAKSEIDSLSVASARSRQPSNPSSQSLLKPHPAPYHQLQFRKPAQCKQDRQHFQGTVKQTRTSSFARCS